MCTININFYLVVSGLPLEKCCIQYLNRVEFYQVYDFSFFFNKNSLIFTTILLQILIEICAAEIKTIY